MGSFGRRVKDWFSYRILRHMNWYQLPPDAGAEAPTQERENHYWLRRAFEPYGERTWQKYVNAPRMVGYSRVVVDALGRLDLPADFTLHDLGCSLGRTEWYIAQRFPQARLSGSDINPDAPAKCREFFGDFADRFSIEVQPTQAWLEQAVRAGRQYDVCMTSDHLVHFPDDSIGQFARLLPQVARRYVILKESWGNHRAGTRWYRHWTTNSRTHWFDRDYAALFPGLELLEKRKLCTHPGRRICALYVFKQPSFQPAVPAQPVIAGAR